MNLTENIEVNFTIPAYDPLKKNALVGKISFNNDNILLNYRRRDDLFKKNKGKIESIQLKYSELNKISIQKNWFKPYKLILTFVGNEELNKKISILPHENVGKLIVEIKKYELPIAKKAIDWVDYKKSEELVNKFDERLEQEKKTL